MVNFQRDGQMQMNVPKSRANYEPNSLADHGEEGGPRECPVTGFTTANGRTGHQEAGEKLRIRPELFADHYSHARLFWKSQTDSEQAHIASLLVSGGDRAKLLDLGKEVLDQMARAIKLSVIAARRGPVGSRRDHRGPCPPSPAAQVRAPRRRMPCRRSVYLPPIAPQTSCPASDRTELPRRRQARRKRRLA